MMHEDLLRCCYLWLGNISPIPRILGLRFSFDLLFLLASQYVLYKLYTISAQFHYLFLVYTLIINFKSDPSIISRYPQAN